MKNLFLLTILSLAPLGASASGLVCKEPPKLNIMEPTYRAELTTDSRHAHILEGTPRDLFRIATIDCSPVRFDGDPKKEHAELRCVSPAEDDAGFELVISSGGFDEVSAQLFRRTKTGSELVAHMPCQYQ